MGAHPTNIVDSQIADLRKHYRSVRDQTEQICRPLEIEDYVIQTIEDVSPPKWHLAHTTWFFEQAILDRFISNYIPFHRELYFLFNSYYEGFGKRLDRNRRGSISRPTTAQIYDYRREIDERMDELLSVMAEDRSSEIAPLIILGLAHEQQHQELLLMDIKHILGSNPLKAGYHEQAQTSKRSKAADLEFLTFETGLIEIGAEPGQFAYDIEQPRHRVYVDSFALASRLVTNGEYLEFVNKGGYKEPDLWLSDGWVFVQGERLSCPLYWEKTENGWHEFTLSGLKPLVLDEPVCHVSFYEASAFARWAGKRLPTESEWERAAVSKMAANSAGNFMERGPLHPGVAKSDRASDGPVLKQMAGDLWEWTNSAYLPYPGYQWERGVLGEYNGKFMSGQMVLRGGSCVTPKSHYRPTYRNFFGPDKRWQFSGIRLAEKV